MDLITVDYRDAMRGQWQMTVRDGTAYTASKEGVTTVYGCRPDEAETTQLGAFPDDAILGVRIERAAG